MQHTHINWSSTAGCQSAWWRGQERHCLQGLFTIRSAYMRLAHLWKLWISFRVPKPQLGSQFGLFSFLFLSNIANILVAPIMGPQTQRFQRGHRQTRGRERSDVERNRADERAHFGHLGAAGLISVSPWQCWGFSPLNEGTATGSLVFLLKPHENETSLGVWW